MSAVDSVMALISSRLNAVPADRGPGQPLEEWELGFHAWGPVLIYPFALIQAWIFSKTKSLSYIVSVHLLFDFVLKRHLRAGGSRLNAGVFETRRHLQPQG